MEAPSILNDVLGPVMRGPSSSHTAGSYHIARMACSLLGEKPVAARFTFDPGGSYARTYREQGADLGFAAGILGIPLTDPRFSGALSLAGRKGIRIEFSVSHLRKPDHPNTVEIRLESGSGKKLRATAKSIGGGAVVISELDGWPVALDGKAYEVVVLCDKKARFLAAKYLGSDRQLIEKPRICFAGNLGALPSDKKSLRSNSKATKNYKNYRLIYARYAAPLSSGLRRKIEEIRGVKRIWTCTPIFLIPKGRPLFSSADEMLRLAEKRKLSLGDAALDYEAKLLGRPQKEILEEILRRYEIMRSAVRQGLGGKNIRMKLLRPSAREIFRKEARRKLAIGGVNTRAAARALAALHVGSSGGIVCAAPTGASSGVLAGVVVTLAEEKGLGQENIARALLAAGAIGLIIARRATFAAEIAGCQVEIGAAGAMAAAAVVEAAGGGATQAADAAAIALQNTMGSVCDLVQGICEIPCHTRTAVAASSAFVCADLILGGYQNSIPLDDTIDAVHSSGQMLPAELRCTARGGLALAPSARSLPRLK
jgi:L-serine dehydratase